MALVETNNVEATRNRIEEQFTNSKVSYFYVSSVAQMYEEQAQGNQLILNIIYFLCVFSLLISTISMISNLIINMISRKQDFMIYRTVGITKGKIRRTVLYEALSMGIYSGATGIAMGCVLLPVLSIILSYYVGSMGYSYSYSVMAFLMGVACLISVSSVLFTIQRYVFKTNLIEEIKRS
jgi:ABC-type antimicrobial peptide transport system permease subunit